MDKYLKKFRAADYGHCIIKEELIIPDDEESDDVVLETADKSIDDSLLNKDVSAVSKRSNKTSTGQIKRKKSVRLRNKNDKLSGNPKTINGKELKTTVKAEASEYIDTLCKNFGKSHCQKCNIKSAAIRGKASCSKCKTLLTYSCKSCDKTYCNFTNLGYHMEQRHTSQTHFCPLCSKRFVSRKGLWRHRKIQHGPVKNSERAKVYKCEECTFATFHQSNLSRHVLNKHTNFKVKCENCNKTFTNRQSMNLHLEVYCNKSKRFECHHCGHKVYRKDQMLNHLDHAHFSGVLTVDVPVDLKKPRLCQYCHATLNRRMKYHLKRCESAPLACRLASEMPDQPDIDTALKKLAKVYCENCKTKKPVEKRQRRCKKCDTWLKFICEKCPKNFDYSHKLVHHLGVKHVKNFHCDECNCSYSSLRVLKLHKRNHRPPKQTTTMFECSNCGKSYNTGASFRQHRVSCVGDPKFHCDKCSYKTHFKASLIEHFRAKRATCV